MTAISFNGQLPKLEHCRYCQDLGVVHVKENATGYKSLMRCDCREGTLSPHAFPQWEWKWGKIFTRTTCPLAWFKPDTSDERNVTPGGMMNAIYAKMIEWRKITRLYEDYWKQRKAEFETQQKEST